ncbi:MAG: hypothetical protein IJ309_06530 [Clostridia bacterium]|nr:hypothetical protein [Clostridia bacterium]
MGYNHHGKKGASYVWRVSWYNNGRKYKAFTNKQQALIFMSKLESNYNNCCVSLEKWNGGY